MPRQDVPYGGAICRLKQRIAEIWDKLGEKLHSINGVEGDGAGDVKIMSGDAAVVITSDQVNHQISIGLDQTELPSAAVTSVNGKTGAVVLDAIDIRTADNTPIQTKITALEGTMRTALKNISTEAQNRQAADNVLQGNINSVQASIPGAAATAVANDPTVAQLVTADAQNVKLTGNQNISGVKIVPTVATGSRTQQIANGEKVQNDLDNYALMVRTVDNQRIRGIKTYVIDDINTGILRIETPASTSGVIGVAFDFYESTTRVGYQYIRKNSDSSYQLILGLRNSDGTFTERAL